MTFRLKTAAVFTALAVFAGCAGYVTSKKRYDTRLPGNSRVAVLPFENFTGMEKAGEKITDYFQTLLSGYNHFEAVEFGAVYEALRRYRIRSATLISNNQVDSLVASLNIDYLVIGSIIEYEEHENMYLGRVPQVAFNCRLVDCLTKRTVWVATSSGRGDKGEIAFGIGAVRSADNLARKMVADAAKKISKLFSKE